ncbi:MAG: undecaprenyl-diphosphate phosphatase [Actinomycetota bacterium]
MSLLEAVVLGAVQGLTEFVPISSSGHLVIVPELFGWDHPGLAFDVLLHLASLVALLVYFSGDLLDLARGFRGGDRTARRMTFFLALGTIPAVITGVVWADSFEAQFKDAPAAALQLLITAGILVAAELALRFHTRRTAATGDKLRTVDEMNAGDAAAIGISQAVSIIPGISRSGSTIGTGLVLGMRRDDAARFAFLLAIPALFGASLFELPDLAEGSMSLSAGIGGFIASLVTSYVAIAGLIKFLKTNTLYPFAAYCLVAGPLFYVLVR